jgi:VWFA-related protein
VSVANNKNHPITGLTANDFLIKDNDTLVKPEFFDSQGPASIVFVLDISTSMRGVKWHNLERGLNYFLKKQKGSDFTLVIFNEKPQLLASSINTDALWELFRTIKPDGETALYDGLLLGLDQINCLARRNKAVILLSDGQDNRSIGTLVQVQEKSFLSHTTIYAVGILLDRRQSSKKDLMWSHDVLNNLAETTGGEVFFPTAEQIEPTLEDINNEIRNQYSFGYYPPNKSPGWKNVDVQLTRNLKHANLRYQQRYLLK